MTVRDVLDVLVAETNAPPGKSGIGGVKVEVVYEDDRLNAADAQTAFLKLVQSDKVPVILGSSSSSIALSI